jgi:hypothetical protein
MDQVMDRVIDEAANQFSPHLGKDVLPGEAEAPTHRHNFVRSCVNPFSAFRDTAVKRGEQLFGSCRDGGVPRLCTRGSGFGFPRRSRPPIWTRIAV